MVPFKMTFVDALTDILVKQGSFAQAQASEMKKLFRESSKEAFDEFLLEEGFVTREQLLDALSDYYQTPSFDVVGHFFNHQLLKLFPKDVLLRAAMIPLLLEEDIITFVASEPNNPQLRDIINEEVDFGIEFYVGMRPDITDAIKEFYDESPTTVSESEEEGEGKDVDELIEKGAVITGDEEE